MGELSLWRAFPDNLQWQTSPERNIFIAIPTYFQPISCQWSLSVPPENLENQRFCESFSAVFREYRKGPVTWNGLRRSSNVCNSLIASFKNSFCIALCINSTSVGCVSRRRSGKVAGSFTLFIQINSYIKTEHNNGLQPLVRLPTYHSYYSCSQVVISKILQ